MNKKIITLILAFTLIVSLPLQAAELDVGYIQKLIQDGQNDKALKILKENDISNKPDLRFYKALLHSWNKEYKIAIDILKDLINEYPDRLDFYTQLGRVYGWQGEYEKAEKIIKKAQNRQASPQRTALLAQLAEWQHKWHQAYELRKEAYEAARDTEMETEYEKLLKQAEKKIRPTNFFETELQYDNQLNTNILVGQNRFLGDGLKLEGVLGLNFFDDHRSYLMRVKLQRPLYRNISWSTDLEYLSGSINKNINYGTTFNYKLNQNNTLGLYLKVYEYKYKTDYQTLELENQYRFNKNTLVLKNTSRHYSSGWTFDFAQHIDYYYPRNDYVMHFTLSHYKGGEYVFRFGIELFDKILNEKLELSSFTSWINSKEAANLDMRINLRK